MTCNPFIHLSGCHHLLNYPPPPPLSALGGGEKGGQFLLEIIYARNPPVFDPTKHLTLKLTKNCTGLDFLFLNKIGFFLQVVACGFPQIPLIVFIPPIKRNIKV